MLGRWARGGRTRVATGAVAVAVTGAVAGCSGPPAPVPIGPPPAAAALAAAGEVTEKCPYLSRDQAEGLAGDQTLTLNGSDQTCTLKIIPVEGSLTGRGFTYQLTVMPNENDRFNVDRNRYYPEAAPLAGVGEEAFLRDGAGIVTVGARKGGSFFTVNLVPAQPETPTGGVPGAAPGQAGNGAAEQDEDDEQGAAADPLAVADADGDGVVDADQDGDNRVDADADARAAGRADADDDGIVDDEVQAALEQAQAAEEDPAAAGEDAGAGGMAPVTDLAEAKQQLVNIAVVVASNI